MSGMDDGAWTPAFAPAADGVADDPPPAAVVIALDDASQVGEARRAAAALATRLGFAEVDVGRVALVATEAATNLARHATGGVLLVQPAPAPCHPSGDGDGIAGKGFGVELLAVDRGPGIRDLARAAADGFSTGGSAGQGLGAMRRSADQFDLYSVPVQVPDLFVAPRSLTAPGAGRTSGASAGLGGVATVGAGTIVLARLWADEARTARRASPRTERVRVGGVSVPLAGEPVCGDAWAACMTPGGCRVLVADGLGHGRAAAEAAQLAVRLFRADVARAVATGTTTPLTDLIMQLHAGLRATRGAAVAVAEVRVTDRGVAPGEVRFAGVGNVAASVTAPDGETRSLVSHNGTVGHQLRKVQEFGVPWPVGAVLILHTDGIRTQWRLGASPGLARRDPTVVAAALWRDHARGRDDATVVVIRDAAGDAGDDRRPPS